MVIYVFECSVDKHLQLLLPSMDVPLAAKPGCRGEWKFQKQITDFSSTDRRVALDSKKAADEIETQGFHIARFEIRTEEKTGVAPPTKKHR